MNKLVLSLFPGLGLLDKAFEAEGFTVVRGPDILWGSRVQDFHPPRGVFAGIIGGPPCQPHSQAKAILDTSEAVDLIPDFVRCVDEGQPLFAVMENVRGAIGHEAVPKAWHQSVLCDCDCGGETKRTRAFWTWPFFMMVPGGKWGGEWEYSVMASTAKRGRSSAYAADKRFLPGDLSIEEYERLQGVPGITKELRECGASKYLAVHMLGNGVPMSMGRYVAKAAMASLTQ